MKQYIIVCAVLYSLSLRLHFVATYEHNTNGFKPDGDTLRVLVNNTAQIKCDVGSNLLDDKVLLVVWYKNNLPIYSYDTRGAHAGTPSHWRDDEVLEDRAVFRTHKEPAELIINPVKEKDAGNFRCRVDFKLSQTRNSNINLEVIVPPQKPNIFNERRMRIDLQAGPYEEGGSLELTCVVNGGSPPPTVIWLMNGQTQNSVADYSFDGTINSKLIVRNLSRIHQHAIYTCQASNFHKKYVATNVTIELYLRPMLVEMSFSNQPMSADREYEIECHAIGSRPPAKISWWMGNMELGGHSQSVQDDGNVSTSILNITPTRSDHGRALSCRATNDLVRNGIRETAMKLNVFFIPSLQLDLGSNLNPEDIEEGDDVYFECKVHANPAAYKVVWKHNNQIIQHNQRAGVIVSSGDLALQGVTQHQAGNYTCTASNVEGDGDSNIVQLKVMYKPICRPDQKKIYGVARNEEAQITCEVDAFPPPESFKWSFNNTAETFDMPQSGFRRHSAQGSTLTYTPVKEMDFGTIMCWADNNVGQQKEPCVFHLIAAGKPDIPINCTVVNQTSDALEIWCNEGFDGGLRQWFLMELYDKQNGIVQANISSKYPMFTVSGLDAAHAFKIYIFAVNARGRSEPVLIEGFTLKAADKQTIALISYKGTQSSFTFAPILSAAILFGVLLALICVSIGTVMAFKLRTYKQHQKYQQQQQNQKFARPENLRMKDKISLPLSHSEEIFDEKNPDVVPDNKVDGEFKHIIATQTPSGQLLPTNEPNMSSDPSANICGMYTKKKDETYYAEPLLHNSATSNSSLTGNGIEDRERSTQNFDIVEEIGGSNNNIMVNCGDIIIGESITHRSCLRNTCTNAAPANNGTSILHHLPTENYKCLEDPPAYGQSDQCNIVMSLNSNVSTANLSTFQHNISSSLPQEIPPTLSPAIAQICAIFPQTGGFNHDNMHFQNTLRKQHQFQTTEHKNRSFNMINDHLSYQYGALTMPPSYQQQILGPILVGSNNASFTSISPSNSVNDLSATTKSYSREIVTVRTPLMYSQQESCV